MRPALLAFAVVVFLGCDTTAVPDAGLCSALTCSGCCDANGVCRAGGETNACGRGGFLCIDCSASGLSCGTGGCFSSATGGGGSATGGGATGGGGGSATGGGTTGGGGGAVTGGGGGSATGGGGGSVTGGGGGAVTGGGGGSATGGGGSATGGGGSVTGGGGASCVPESNTAFCIRLSAECGARTAADNCGTQRTVASCGSCENLQVCGADGMNNQCGTPGVRLNSELVAPDRRGAGATVVRYDASGFMHALYIDLVEGDVFHAWRTSPTGWQRELAFDSAGQQVTIVDAAYASTALKVLALFRGGTSQLPTYEYRLYTRAAAGGWTRETLTLPTGFSFPRNTLHFEANASLAVASYESTGQSTPNCRLTLQRPTSATTWGAAAVVTTWYSFDPCSSVERTVVLDGNGRSAIALKGIDASPGWSVVVEGPVGTWTRSATTAPWGLPLTSRNLAVGADGTIHLLGVSAATSQYGYQFGSGMFWTEEAVPGFTSTFGGAVDRMDLVGNEVLFTRVESGFRTSGSTQYVRLTIKRSRRTAANTFTALPDRVLDQDYVGTSGIFGRTLVGLDPAQEPVMLTGRYANASGAGTDITDWPAGTQRTVELDWREHARALDLVHDDSGTPHALFVMGETAYGQGRLVVRSRLNGMWTEGPSILPALPGNGNGVVTARLRIDAMGRKRVLTPGLFVSGSSSSSLILATEDANGAWQREEVVRLPVGSSLGSVDFMLDAAGTPHVVYGLDTTLRYATKSGGTWTTELAVASTGIAASRPRIVVDANGTPCLGYVFGSGYSLGFARRVNGVWQSASFSDGNGYGFGLGVDGQGRACLVHVIYSSGLGYEVTLNCLVGSALQPTVINTAPLTLWGMATTPSGRFFLFGWETFVTSPSLYSQGPAGWTLEHLIDPWPTQPPWPLFSVTPSGAPALLVKETLPVDRWFLRTR